MYDKLSWPVWFGALTALLIAGCAGGETNASSGNGGSPGSTSTATGGSGGDATSSGGVGGMGGAGGQGGQGGSGGIALGPLAPSLISLDQLYVDCMPIVGPDPVHGSFNASYDNSAGSGFGQAVITSSRLVFSDGKAWIFSVLPNSSGMVSPGQTITVAHVKQDGSGAGTALPCDYCNGTWTLDVTWDVAGQVVTDTLGPAPVQCVF